jgi:hypothetical protein
VSISVALDELERVSAEYGFAYLITVADDGRPHLVALTPRFTGSGIFVAEVGRRSLANATTRPNVTLVWPPVEPGGYSLVCDADASPGEDPGTVSLQATWAVLHRPAP